MSHRIKNKVTSSHKKKVSSEKSQQKSNTIKKYDVIRKKSTIVCQTLNMKRQLHLDEDLLDRTPKKRVIQVRDGGLVRYSRIVYMAIHSGFEKAVLLKNDDALNLVNFALAFASSDVVEDMLVLIGKKIIWNPVWHLFVYRLKNRYYFQCSQFATHFNKCDSNVHPRLSFLTKREPTHPLINRKFELLRTDGENYQTLEFIKFKQMLNIEFQSLRNFGCFKPSMFCRFGPKFPFPKNFLIKTKEERASGDSEWKVHWSCMHAKTRSGKELKAEDTGLFWVCVLKPKHERLFQ